MSGDILDRLRILSEAMRADLAVNHFDIKKQTPADRQHMIELLEAAQAEIKKLRGSA